MRRSLGVLFFVLLFLVAIVGVVQARSEPVLPLCDNVCDFFRCPYDYTPCSCSIGNTTCELWCDGWCD